MLTVTRPRRALGTVLRRAFAPWLRPRPWIIAPFVVVVVLVAVPQAYALYTGTTANPSSNFTAAGTFPTYPSSVTGDSATFYHRGEDAASAAVTSTAADSSTAGTKPGTYNDSTDGPVLWWRLDDGAGTTAVDRSGGADPGTLTNGPTWGVGVTGTAATLDGTNDAVVADQAVNTDLSFTVSAWVYPTASGASRTVLSQAGTNVAAFNLRYDSTGYWQMSMPRTDSTGATVDTATSAIPALLNRWTHLIGVYNDTTDLITLYVNGVQSDTAAHTTDFAAYGSFAAGQGWFSSAANEFLTGRVDEVRAYPRALTAAQVDQLYGSPTLRYEFIGGATDTSGNANNATATGAPSYTSNYLTLNGTSQYVQSASPPVRTDDSFTISARVYSTNTTGAHTIASAPGTSGNAFTLRSSGTTWQFRATDSDGGATVTTTSVTPVTTSAWVTVAGVYSDPDDELRLYVNGVLQDTVAKTADWASTNGMLVGRNQIATADYFTGRLDDVRTWDHPLTSTDLATLPSLDPDLTAHYELDEGSGTTLADIAGNSETATLAGGYTWNSTGHNNNSVTFNGTTGYAATASQVVTTTASYTVSAWARLNTIITDHHTIVSQDATNISGFFLKYCNLNGINTWQFVTEGTNAAPGANEATATATTPTVLGEWTFVTGVYDDTNDLIKIYVNGVLESTAPQSFEIAATGSLIVGAGKYGAGSRIDFFPGSIDEVRTYNRALSDTEISALFNRIPSPSLSWHLDESSGTAADSSGNGHTGTTTNTTWVAGYTNNGLSFAHATTNTLTTTFSVNTDNSYSVGAWVKLTALGTTRTAISQDGTSYSGYQLGYDSTLGWVFRTRGSSVATTIASSGGTPVAGAWTHLVGVHDDLNDIDYLYVNGVLVDTTADANDWATTGSTVLGRARSGGSSTEKWSGLIDEVNTFKGVVDVSSLADLMGSTTPHISPSTLLHLPTLSAGRVGALQGTQQGQRTSTAVAFSGASNVYLTTPIASVNTFSVEAWFRASGTAGGAIVGYSNLSTAMTGDTADRLVYLDSAGKVRFGVAPGGVISTIVSANTYNDAAWHHVVATLGAAGMNLYVDGVSVAAANTGVTTGRTVASGYWRWGGINLTGYTADPTSDYFIGSIDEVAYYTTQLTATQVARHYAADH
jgi:hypothetical protein